MTFQPDYPDLDKMTVDEKISELLDKFISLSRETEFAVNHIDGKNFTNSYNKIMSDEFGSISSLQQTAKSLTIEVTEAIPQQIEDATSVTGIRNKLNTASYVFGASALDIYNAGIQIWNGSKNSPGERVFYADTAGNLHVKNAFLENISLKTATITDGSFTVRNSDGSKMFGVSSGGDGIYLQALTLYSPISNTTYGYMGLEYDVNINDYYFNINGLSVFGPENVSASSDRGLAFSSNYGRRISSYDGVPTASEKQQRSGISFNGDVVLNSFNDGYYRYPVVADANYKLRMYFQENTLWVEKYNAKTNQKINSYRINPDEIL